MKRLDLLKQIELSMKKGIFDKDIEFISQKIQINNLSLSDLQFALKINFDILKDNLSFVSNYIIRRMI